MSAPNPSRRRFLVHTAITAATVPLGATLLTRPAQAQDIVPLPLDNATAAALAYSEDASGISHPSFKSGSNCTNCQFYTGAGGDARGPCTLFPGFSVAAAGWCTAWAAKA
jgi:hypothetical protein